MVRSVLKKQIVRAPINMVWARIIDLESYPSIMTSMEKVTVIEFGDDWSINDWEAEIDGVPVLWVDKTTFMHSQYRMEFAVVKGDFKIWSGYWQLKELSATSDVLCNPVEQVEVELYVMFDLGMDSIDKLIGPTLEESIGENSKLMLRAIQETAEGA